MGKLMLCRSSSSAHAMSRLKDARWDRSGSDREPYRWQLSSPHSAHHSPTLPRLLIQTPESLLDSSPDMSIWDRITDFNVPKTALHAEYRRAQ